MQDNHRDGSTYNMLLKRCKGEQKDIVRSLAPGFETIFG